MTADNRFHYNYFYTDEKTGNLYGKIYDNQYNTQHLCIHNKDGKTLRVEGYDSDDISIFDDKERKVSVEIGKNYKIDIPHQGSIFVTCLYGNDEEVLFTEKVIFFDRCFKRYYRVSVDKGLTIRIKNTYLEVVNEREINYKILDITECK